MQTPGWVRQVVTYMVQCGQMAHSAHGQVACVHMRSLLKDVASSDMPTPACWPLLTPADAG